MRIAIAVSILLDKDAIGNDVAHEALLLNRRGMSAMIYTWESENPRLAEFIMDHDDLMDLIHNPRNILIYHHAGSWEQGQAILEKARCRIFVRYHNITPPEFFKPYNSFHDAYCRKGMEQTRAMAGMDKISAFLCDSGFNAADFSKLGVADSRIGILPPFHRVDDFEQARLNQKLARRLDGGGQLNILFVGRLVPNKGHKHLLRVMAGYIAMYGTDIRLNLVGSNDPGLVSYRNELDHLIRQNHLDQVVKIHGSVSFDDLYTYYKTSHIFLLMSDHEGFCLPVLEAQYLGLPIVALAAGAVPETLGENQILFDRPDARQFAAAIHVLAGDAGARDYIAAEGRKNMNRFSNTLLEEKFLAAILSPAE